MIIIPACLRCEYLEKGMTCKFYPEGIPKQITLSHKPPEETCKYLRKRKVENTTSQK